jgi:hypothetical protein
MFKIALYESIPRVPHNIELRQELAENICQAVVSDVHGLAANARIEEGDHGELTVMRRENSDGDAWLDDGADTAFARDDVFGDTPNEGRPGPLSHG